MTLPLNVPGEDGGIGAGGMQTKGERLMRKWQCLVVAGVMLAAGAAQATMVLLPSPPLPESAARTIEGSDLKWYDLRDLLIEGQGWTELDSPYDRFPAKAKDMPSTAVWNLSLDSTGIAGRFVTNAPEIHARWTLREKNLAIPHMPATGYSGVDLYVRQADRWQWVGMGAPTQFPTSQDDLATGIPEGRHEYILYLPLYNGVTEVLVGIPAGSTISPVPPRPEGEKPIVFYGTSILQGASAGRTGMAFTNILGRWLNRETINLGFSGNGRMQPDAVELLAEIDAEIFVIDALPNMNPDLIAERMVPAVKLLREKHPKAPIILVEDRDYGNAAFLPGRARTNQNNRAALRKAYETLVADGVERLIYVKGDNLVGTDGEGTIDGSHPNDLGMVRQAEAMMGPLKEALEMTAGEQPAPLP